MKIWYVRDLEPIPTDPDNPRLMRAGMLATTLASLGHDTTWFTSTFNHFSRRHRDAGISRPCNNLTINILPAPGYSHNISAKRLLHNWRFARAFLKHAKIAEELPDIILADLPTTDAAAAAIAFARRRNIPSVVTVRDLWPDFFPNFVPHKSRFIARLATWPLDREAQFACRNATSLVGISDQYLEWGRGKGNRSHSERDRVFPLGYLKLRQPEGNETESVLHSRTKPHQHVVTFVGSWGVTYDLPLVFETARLLSRRKDIVFALAGNASEQPELKCAFQDLDNTILLGWIDQNKVASLLERSSIGLLPYTADSPQGLPNKVYDYMAFGTFQLATLTGEVEHLYRETGIGLSVPNASPTDFVNAIEAILSDRRTIEAREERITIFNTRFDARKIYRELADHIAAVASQKH